MALLMEQSQGKYMLETRLATSLFPKSPRQTHSTARNLSAGPKQKEVGK